jgi:hypothetical protein
MNWQFWKKSPLQSLDPHMAAFAILDRMFKVQPPFNEWRPEDVEIPEVAGAFIEIGVWAYQLTIFVDCIEKKFGADTAQIVRTHLLTLLERWDNKHVMKGYFAAVVVGRASTERELFFSDQPDIQIDCNVARALLSTSAESEEAKDAVYPILGHALTLGRLSAQVRFAPLVDKMEFKPETVIGLRKPKETPMEWSESPGCFERHLQRRFQNPLFPVDRQNITTSELISAQARDEAERMQLQEDFKAALEKAKNFEDRVPMSECLALREEIESLIIRCAEVGATTQLREAVQSIYASVIGCLRNGCPPEERQTLENALTSSAEILAMKADDFFAQLTRSDTPFTGGDVIPALLSESVETVGKFVTYWTGMGKTIDQETVQCAVAIVRQATANGPELPDIEQKLGLLTGSASRTSQS